MAGVVRMTTVALHCRLPFRSLFQCPLSSHHDPPPPLPPSTSRIPLQAVMRLRDEQNGLVYHFDWVTHRRVDPAHDTSARIHSLLSPSRSPSASASAVSPRGSSRTDLSALLGRGRTADLGSEASDDLVIDTQPVDPVDPSRLGSGAGSVAGSAASSARENSRAEASGRVPMTSRSGGVGGVGARGPSRLGKWSHAIAY